MELLVSLCCVALLVVQKVCKRRGQQFRVVLEGAKRSIAMRAQDSTDRSSAMVVIQSEGSWVAAWRGSAKALADSAYATLAFKNRIVLMRLYAEFFAPMAIRSKTSRFLPVLCAPLRLLAAGASPAKALQSISLRLVVCEFKERFYLLAATTPFHPIRSLRAALGELVVPTQVVERLAFNPSERFSVSSSDVGWPSAPAFANSTSSNRAFYRHGYHAFLTLCGKLYRSKE